MRFARVLLVIVAAVCLGVALSYPIRYRQAQEKNDTDMEDLARMRQQTRQSQADGARDDAVFPAFPERRASDPDGEAATPEDGSSPLAGREQAAQGAGGSAPEPSMEGGLEAAPEDGAGSSTTGAVRENPSEETGGSGTNASYLPGKGPDGGGADASAIPPEEAGGSGMDASNVPAQGTGGSGDKFPEGRSQALGGSGTGNPEAGGEGAGTGSIPAGQLVDAAAQAGEAPTSGPTPKPTPTPEPTLEPNYWDLGKYYAPTPTPTPTPKPTKAGPTVEPTPTPDRSIRNGALPYALKDKVVLDEAAMLPELKDIYALNKDLVGWINIPDTVIDYPVVQAENGDFYLTHDFYGEENINGQIIMDVLCDPYTPSYNLVISGHHMKNGSMFGDLPQYRSRSYWEKHPFLEFDSLMERKIYVIFACFYSADYDEDETGFRYNAIIDYKIDADRWLEEIARNQLYDTGIEREFGDEFITLTTCDRARHRNGRFVVVGRKIREGETFE